MYLGLMFGNTLYLPSLGKFTVTCIVFPASVDTATEEDSDCTVELVGGIVATFFVTILVYTVALVTVIVVGIKFRRNRYLKL